MFHIKETSVTFPAALRRLWDHIWFITGHQWASWQRVWWWFRARNIPKTRLWKLLHRTLATEIPRENTDITYNAVEKSPTVTVLYLLWRYPEQNERQPQTHAGLFDGINKPSLRVSDETRPDSCPCHGNKQLGWPSLILHTASTHRGNCQYTAFRQPCNVLQKGGLLWGGAGTRLVQRPTGVSSRHPLHVDLHYAQMRNFNEASALFKHFISTKWYERVSGTSKASVGKNPPEATGVTTNMKQGRGQSWRQ